MEGYKTANKTKSIIKLQKFIQYQKLMLQKKIEIGLNALLVQQINYIGVCDPHHQPVSDFLYCAIYICTMYKSSIPVSKFYATMQQWLSFFQNYNYYTTSNDSYE